MVSEGTAFLIDLDGTLVDSVYQHVLAWRAARRRRYGKSGNLFRPHRCLTTPQSPVRLAAAVR